MKLTTKSKPFFPSQLFLIMRFPETEAYDRRIINGAIAKPGQYPYYVLLEVVKLDTEGSSYFRCGGGTISSYFVLTAAHCLFNRSYTNLVFPISNLEDPLRTMKVDKSGMIIHESYNPTNYDNDIALLRLPFARRQESAEIKYLQLPDPNFAYEGVKVEIVGMGYDSLDLTQLSTALKIFHPNIISLQTCTQAWNVKLSNICAVEQSVNEKRSVCMGDSGGPLVLPGVEQFTVIGVASYGRSDCNPSTPQVFTRVGAYNDWVLGEICNQTWEQL